MNNHEQALKGACAVCYGSGFDVTGKPCAVGCRAALQPTEQPGHIGDANDMMGADHINDAVEMVRPEAAEQAAIDCILHGTGAYIQNPDRSREHVPFEQLRAEQPEAAQALVEQSQAMGEYGDALTQAQTAMPVGRPFANAEADELRLELALRKGPAYQCQAPDCRAFHDTPGKWDVCPSCERKGYLCGSFEDAPESAEWKDWERRTFEIYRPAGRLAQAPQERVAVTFSALEINDLCLRAEKRMAGFSWLWQAVPLTVVADYTKQVIALLSLSAQSSDCRKDRS